MPVAKQSKKRPRSKSPGSSIGKTTPSKASSKSSSSSSARGGAALPSAGYLLTCDPPTKQFIKSLNETKSTDKKFILEDLDPTHLLVRERAREEILRKVEEWMDQNVFTNVERVGENLET